MRSLGQLAATVLIGLPLSAQQPHQAQALPIHVAPGPRVVKPVLPTRPNTPAQESERIDKRRERMKGRDGEIDRMLKQKAKRN